ncbi:MAG TPA: tetratricopeptide repeat protein [Bryobacterales bacterium]|nr:tetratricopeptide repeat protein [Bryobacterales bacterium]
MHRHWVLACLLCFASSAGLAQRSRQTGPPPAPPEPDQEQENGEPEYTFNPIQAQKELKIGDFYFKKKSYRAAAGRYERATKWQPDLAEAYYKLGESREKLDQNEQALAAYQKYLDLSPPPKQAEEARKKIAQLQKQRSATASK